MNHPRIALCSDYPMSSFTQPIATGLAQLLGHEVSRDQITRYRSGTDFSSRDGLPLAKAAPPHRRNGRRRAGFQRLSASFQFIIESISGQLSRR